MRLLIACILNIAITCAAWSQATPATAPKPEIKVPDDINYEPDVVFGKGGTQDLHADIAYPKNASKPTPAVIYIHGGGWIGGTYKTGSTGPIFIMAKAGIFGASIEYRLAPEGQMAGPDPGLQARRPLAARQCREVQHRSQSHRCVGRQRRRPARRLPRHHARQAGARG